MRAHFPPPETAGLPAWRTQSQRTCEPAPRPLQAPTPGTSMVARSGQSEEAAGPGSGEENGLATRGHRGDTGPIRT